MVIILVNYLYLLVILVNYHNPKMSQTSKYDDPKHTLPKIQKQLYDV